MVALHWDLNNYPDELVRGGTFLTSRISSAFLRRSKFVITDTERRLIAAAARTGLSNNPKNGYSTPAPMGIRSELLTTIGKFLGRRDPKSLYSKKCELFGRSSAQIMHLGRNPDAYD